jgi:hypothetical protein
MPVTLRKPDRPENRRIALTIPRIHPFSQRRTPLTVALVSLLTLTGLAAARFVRERFPGPQPLATPISSNASSVPRVGRRNLGGPSAQPSDPGLLLESGGDFARHKDWAQAERAYRVLLQANPRNREAAMALSDVLYAQRKYEDSAAVLNQVSMGNR